MQTANSTITQKKAAILPYIVIGQIFKVIFLAGKKPQTNLGIKIPSPSLDKGIPDLSEILQLTDSATSKLVTGKLNN